MVALASGLVGFPSTTLRVRVTRTEGAYVWATTADLLDAGTKLVLDASQVSPETASEAVRHSNGLVTMGG